MAEAVSTTSNSIFDKISNRLEQGETAEQLAAKFGPSYSWLVLATCMVTSMISIMPSTTVVVALPDIMSALSMETYIAQWVSTGWLAATVVTMLCVDSMVNRFGVRMSLFILMSLTLATTILCGIALTSEWLIIARVLQGFASGPLPAFCMLTVFDSVPVNKRGLSMGVMAVGIILAPTFGPVLAGLFVEYADWRWCFFFMLPVTALAIPMILTFMPERLSYVLPPRPFDWAGLLLMSLSVFVMLYGISRGAIDGWSALSVQATLLLSLALAVFFTLYELSITYPLVNLRLLKNRQFSCAIILTLLVGLSLYASSFYIPLYVQSHMNFSSLDAGVLYVPAGLAMALVFPIAGHLNDRYDSRIVLGIGVFLLGLSFYLLGSISAAVSTGVLIWWLVLGRIGMGMAMPSLTVASMAAVPPDQLAQASAISNFTRQLGGAIGISALTVYWGNRVLINGSDHAGAMSWDSPSFSQFIFPQKYFNETLMQMPIAVAEEVAQRQLSQHVLLELMTLAYRDLFLFMGISTLLTVGLAFFTSKGYAGST